MIYLLKLYVAFSVGFALVLGYKDFGKRHLIPEAIYVSANIAMLAIPIIYFTSDLRISEIYRDKLFIPYLPYIALGAAFALIYRYFFNKSKAGYDDSH